ncbi:DciA family protein [uncultured Brevundimonas sp.]|uniref:DUF721 domain-containing protein n=1 Tax=uncultured Brevundimonas sp. TaxID=213418 RepID=UPI002605A8F8|nr:DciA family protein [uncultured Brevundimonas sp.]
MRRRPLPSEEETLRILSERRTKRTLRPPPLASQKLQKFIRELDQKFGRDANSLEPRWAEIVGERIARVSNPMRIIKGKGNAGGVLELKVVGPAALLVQHQQEEIINQVNLYLGSKTVEKIRIQQGPVKALTSAAKPKSRTRPPLPPIPPAAEAELEQSVAHLPEHLRKALTKLGKAAIVRSQEEADDPYR